MTNEKEKNQKKIYLDYEIFSGPVKLILENGKSEVIDRDRGIEMARENNMNLVQIAYNKNSYPKAICKLINYSKFKYEQKKKDKEMAKKARQANAEAKEIVFSIRIDDNDKKIKINHIRDFLVKDNSKVKVTVKLSKREMNLLGMAKDLMNYIVSQLSDCSSIDTNTSFNSGIMSCVLKPVK